MAVFFDFSKENLRDVKMLADTRRIITDMKPIFRIIGYACFLILICHALYAAEPKEVKRILIFHSEDTENQGQRLTEEGIRSVLLLSHIFDIKLYTEYLNKSRFGSATNASAMADFLRRKYAVIQIDAIITVYPSAVDFLFAEGESLFPRAPVIAAVITRMFADSIEPSPMRSLVTGIIVGEKITDLMDEALVLKPRTKRVALVAGASDSKRRNMLEKNPVDYCL